MSSPAWEEAKHCAAFLARGHIPREVRVDWPYDITTDGKTRRCYGYVAPDMSKRNEPGFSRTYAIAILAGMRSAPFVAPRRNGSTDDADLLARAVQGRWEDVEGFLQLRFEADALCKSKRYRRLACAVYEGLVATEVLDQDDLKEIHDQEELTCST